MVVLKGHVLVMHVAINTKLFVHALSHDHACLYEMNLMSMLDMKYDEHDMNIMIGDDRCHACLLPLCYVGCYAMNGTYHA